MSINIFNFKVRFSPGGSVYREVPGIGRLIQVGMGDLRAGWVLIRSEGGEQHLEDDKVLDGVGYGSWSRVEDVPYGVLLNDAGQPRIYRCRRGHEYPVPVVNGGLQEYCPKCGAYGAYITPLKP